MIYYKIFYIKAPASDAPGPYGKHDEIRQRGKRAVESQRQSHDFVSVFLGAAAQIEREDQIRFPCKNKMEKHNVRIADSSVKKIGSGIILRSVSEVISREFFLIASASE